METAKYGIGIDLGTSNCALAFVDLAQGAGAPIRHFPIPQWLRPGEFGPRPVLPSCLYLPGEHELPPESLRLPWNEGADCLAGEFGRWQGARVPGRLVASAKSWLCHEGVDRSAAILPWGGPGEVGKISPVEASARLLKYLFDAWNAAHPEDPIAAQEVVVTVPASFDEAARALTVQATRRAGLEHFTLLEEPQAAFYDFTARHREALREALAAVRLALVVDVGGGTTDFSLVAVELAPEGPSPRRIAVGDHLLLGGDNMDATLARHLEARMTSQGRRLSAAQWNQLLQASREAKERLLGPEGLEKCALSVAAEGSRLFGGTLSASLSREEAERLILEGFLPCCEAGAAVWRGTRTAIHELGLPYAQDTAITRHLAEFLRQHAAAARAARGDDDAAGAVPGSAEAAAGPGCAPVVAVPRPDAILLNGGVFYSPAIVRRLVAAVSAWWPGLPKIPLLDNDALDLAVARGAAYYTLARRGQGRRITGGASHAFYIGLGSRKETGVSSALCVVPRGFEEGGVVELSEQAFQLTLGRPVQFPLYSSTVDRGERSGQIMAVTDDLHPLPPLHTILTSAQSGHPSVTVHLKAALTEIGTLELWCIDPATRERWRLEFELRGVAKRRLAAAESMPGQFTAAREWIERLYPGKRPPGQPGPAGAGTGPKDVRQLWSSLERGLGPREQWRLPMLREMWTVLHAGAAKRRRAADQEKVFFQLCGYCLRPGFGYPLDDWRCEQAFTLFGEGVEYHKEKAVWTEFWVFWRRVSGGLSEESQMRLWDYVKPQLEHHLAAHVPKHAPRPKGIQPEGWDEMIRTAAAMEHLPVAEKIGLGVWIAERLTQAPAGGPWAWALGRVGARAPVYGSGHRTVPPEQAEAWLDLLLARDPGQSDGTLFAMAQLSRLTGDRSRDIGETARARALDALGKAQAPEAWLKLVTEAVELTRDDEARVLGDTLPVGLLL